MQELGKIHEREIVAIEKVAQHANPALVGFYRLKLSDRTEQLLSPSEIAWHVEKGFVSAQAVAAVDAPAAEAPAEEAPKAPEPAPEAAAREGAEAPAAEGEAPKAAKRARKAKPAE